MHLRLMGSGRKGRLEGARGESGRPAGSKAGGSAIQAVLLQQGVHGLGQGATSTPLQGEVSAADALDLCTTFEQTQAATVCLEGKVLGCSCPVR
jgi:hypothetical protein